MLKKSLLKPNSFHSESLFLLHPHLSQIRSTSTPPTVRKFLQPGQLIRDMYSVRWPLRGVDPPVENQGRSCHCLIYSSVCALKCSEKIRNQRWQKPSKQHVLDECPWSFEVRVPAPPYFKFLEGKKIALESKYPLNYVGDKLVKQTFDPEKAKEPHLWSGWKLVEGLQAIEDAVRERPVVGMICADVLLQKHPGGCIFEDPVAAGSKRKRNHAVLIVGFGTCDEGDYWEIQNSWGDEWADNGRARVLKGINLRGIEISAYVPVFEEV